jgi:hypothetical protein
MGPTKLNADVRDGMVVEFVADIARESRREKAENQMLYRLGSEMALELEALLAECPGEYKKAHAAMCAWWRFMAKNQKIKSSGAVGVKSSD